MLSQVYYIPILLFNLQVLSIEGGIELLVRLYDIVALTSTTIACCDGRVVADLLSQVLHIIIDKLICFTQERIEWLESCMLKYSKCSDHVNGDKSKSLDWILLLACQVQEFIILHSLCTLLEQTCRVIQVHWESCLIVLFADILSD